MVHPAAKKSTPALKASMLNVLNANYKNRTAATRMWSTAQKCPLFLKKTLGKKHVAGAKKSKKKKIALRVNRALNGHTLKTLASGAAANAAVVALADAAQLRCDVIPENPRYPLLPSVNRGAAALIEAAFIAYMQEMFGASIALKNNIGQHKKVTARCAQMAANSVNERISQATAFVPSSVVAPAGAAAKKTKKVAAA